MARPPIPFGRLRAGACLAALGGWALAGLAAPGGLEAQPFAPRSGPRGATLFARVPAEASGLRTENHYDDPDMWGRRAREFDLGGVGTGVAIGDYDGDGRPDVFVVSKTEGCRLFRNLGGWRFEDVTARAGVADAGPDARVWKQGAAFADVDNDGRLDLYLCRFNAPNRLYMNQGDGTFREQARARGLDVHDASVMACFADYDRDGWLDAFLQTNVLDTVANPEGQRDYLFRNNGDGTFTNVTARAGVARRPTHGNSALWWDGDEDGWPDLYVANDFAVPDALYRNNRDGTFTDVIGTVMPVAAYSAMGSDFGDVDNDGRLDLLVADMAATDREKDQRTMAETRARMRLPPKGEIRQFPASMLYLGTGTGRCLEAAQLAGIAATDWTWSPRWEDLDEDGRLDLHVTNGMYREIHNQDLIARRMGAENQAARGQVTRQSPVLAERNLAFRNLGELRFAEVSADWGLDHRGVSFGSALGDLDGDGDLDLVYANYQDGATVLRNDNDAGHRVVVALRGLRSNRFGIGARIVLENATGRQVRVLQPARGFMSSSEPVAHFGVGQDPDIRRLTVTWPGGTVQAFDHPPVDHRLTITEPAAEPGPAVAAAAPAAPQFSEVAESAGLAWTAAEESFDEFLDQRLLPFGLNRRGPAVAVGRVDATERESVVIGGTTRAPLALLSPGNDRRWAPAAAPALASAPLVNDGPVLLFDATGQGRADLLVTAGGTSEPAGSSAYQPRLYLNDGFGRFEPAPAGTLPRLSLSAGAACAADFDRDGRLDVFVGGRVVPGQYPVTPPSALLANRGGRFEDVTAAVAPHLQQVGLVTAALWSDADGDAWPDLLVTLEWGEVRYFHNEQGRGFTDWTERSGFATAGTGWWRSIAAADFNRDGRMDYAVGNLGLNTTYQAGPDRPVVLFHGDFAGRGLREIIEASSEDHQWYPRRSRTDLGAAIPGLFRRFRTNNDYARASLPEILGPERLAAAVRLAATELRSGVLLSRPDGNFRFAPWPRLAQVSPANGLVAADFDGDGQADLCVVQNSYAPAAAIGRFDGGLGQMLRGDGRGGFAVVPPATSGLVVPGDAKALAVLDLDEDGWPDLLASRNGEPSLAFRNGGLAARHSLRVLLQGRPGNPRAIGACLTAEYADGSRPVAEVAAGSGYATQSTSDLFLGYTDELPLRRLHVRWPSGRTTVVDDPAASATRGSLRVKEPLD